jgi:hypothetical protein
VQLKKPTGEDSPPSLRALSQRLDNTSAFVFFSPGRYITLQFLGEML